jgi:hypothetical protein
MARQVSGTSSGRVVSRPQSAAAPAAAVEVADSKHKAEGQAIGRAARRGTAPASPTTRGAPRQTLSSSGRAAAELESQSKPIVAAAPEAKAAVDNLQVCTNNMSGVPLLRWQASPCHTRPLR